jgi:DNA ligase D
VAASPSIDIEVAGRVVPLSNPDKVMFPQHGETKHDVVRHYLAVGDAVLHAMQGRPVLLERYPNGVGKSSFFQKRVPEKRPDWLQTTEVSTPNGTTSDALVIGDLAHVVWAVNLGVLGFHVWPYRAADPAHADELRIDLDPSPGVTWDMVRTAGFHARDLLAELGLRSYPKTTGNRGLHVYVRLLPQWDRYQVRDAAVAFARELERRHLDLVTAQWWKEQRGTRVFVDFNQNAPHKTVFGAWSIRPRVGAQVSTPITWDDLHTIHPDDVTIRNVADRLAEHGDPWADIDAPAQSLEPLVELAVRDADRGLPDAPWPPQYPKMPNEPRRVQPSRARHDD